ncbi:retrotransposable element Tf2 [Tanacetum coccineum]|uniref:Retrotransposable element Tf2 n=1 Tax=Tanacetum coccineum TaxID=301880 RepID=A0ABQ5JA83_9ASTR
MDLIDGLPLSKGKAAIMVVVDRLSKAAHFMALSHPYTAMQSDGQTEVVNRCLECYLRCMCGEKPKEWTTWLPMVEYWYNTSYHTSIKTTPYQAVYGQSPLCHITYQVGDSVVDTVDKTMVAREKANQMLQFHIKRAHGRMKNMANKNRTDREFAKQDWVYLKLQPYRQSTIRKGKYHKLTTKYYGPFQVIKKVRKGAYKS